MDEGFEKWIKSLPLDFIQHMWEFYQEDIDGADMAPHIIGRVVLFDGTNEPLYGSRKQARKMTETDVFEAALELGLTTEQALRILQWKPRLK